MDRPKSALWPDEMCWSSQKSDATLNNDFLRIFSSIQLQETLSPSILMYETKWGGYLSTRSSSSSLLSCQSTTVRNWSTINRCRTEVGNSNIAVIRPSAGLIVNLVTAVDLDPARSMGLHIRHVSLSVKRTSIDSGTQKK